MINEIHLLCEDLKTVLHVHALTFWSFTPVSVFFMKTIVFALIGVSTAHFMTGTGLFIPATVARLKSEVYYLGRTGTNTWLSSETKHTYPVKVAPTVVH